MNIVLSLFCGILSTYVFLAFADPSSPQVQKIEIIGVRYTVEVKSYTSYLSKAQLAAIPNVVGNRVDPLSKETLITLLSAPQNGIPSRSHTWAVMRQWIDYRWAGKKGTYPLSKNSLSWLPRGPVIRNQGWGEAGRNYSDSETKVYMERTKRHALDELIEAADRVRGRGFGEGMQMAHASRPILSRLRPLKTRRIVRRKVSQLASFLDQLARGANTPGEIYNFGEIPINESFYQVLLARVDQLDSARYSNFRNRQRFDLVDRAGTTNCIFALSDSIVGGQSRAGTIEKLEPENRRGYSASAMVHRYFLKHAAGFVPSRAMAKRLRNGTPPDHFLNRNSGSCKCIPWKDSRQKYSQYRCHLKMETAQNQISLQACDLACTPNGIFFEEILNHCKELELR